MPNDGSYLITAYVNKQGRVVTAGVSAAAGGEPEMLDCLVQGLRSWKMPKPKSTLAKISFPLAAPRDVSSCAGSFQACTGRPHVAELEIVLEGGRKGLAAREAARVVSVVGRAALGRPCAWTRCALG